MSLRLVQARRQGRIDLPGWRFKAKAVIQRVNSSTVVVEDRVISKIGRGLLVLLGIGIGDGKPQVEYLAEKVLTLRIFPDDDGKMNLSVCDYGGELMVVSQFTLMADCRKGRRPSFTGAAEPEIAEPIYEDFIDCLKLSGLDVATGVFREIMTVSLDNWGPVTFVIDT